MALGQRFGLLINKPELLILLDSVNSALPFEACGLLGGTLRRQQMSLHVYPATNFARSKHAFLIRSKELRRLQREIRQAGLNLVGCYHSHPRGGAVPSSADKNQAGQQGFIWIICAPLQRSIRAFSWSGQRFTSRSLRLEN